MEHLNGEIHHIYQTLYIIYTFKAHSFWDIGIITVINGYIIHVLTDWHVYQDGVPFIPVKCAFDQRTFPVGDHGYELQPESIEHGLKGNLNLQALVLHFQSEETSYE